MKTLFLFILLKINCYSLFFKNFQEKTQIFKNKDFHKCHIASQNIQQVVKTKIPQISKDQLPKQWIWSDINGKNYLTIGKNQHIPQYCGSCWAFASTSAMSDRIKIMRQAQWPDINISPQVLISCESPDNGCHGGDAPTAYNYIHKYYITDETCSIYQARGHDNGLPCTPDIKCKTCDKNGCFVPESYYIYTVEEFGAVNGEESMMNEIQQRGPIVCGIAVTNELFNYTGGIFEDKTGAKEIEHDISVVGYGEENGVPYWTIRNSWGTYWGEEGYFRLIRGKNNLMIESDCHFAVPKDTWTQGQKNFTSPENSPIRLPFQNKESSCIRQTDKNLEWKILTPEPYTYLQEDDIPKEWDWRNINGQNFMSWSVNHQIPQFCGSCWAHGTTSAISDRINILRNNKFPQIAINRQVLINCKVGSCKEGLPYNVYKFMHENGIGDNTCEQYQANEPLKQECSDIQQCMNCFPPPPAIGQKGDCVPVTDFKKWNLREFGQVKGAQKMKAEIFKRGPISCGIHATDKFFNYKGGIFSQKNEQNILNYEVSVVGWGIEDGKEYWIGRNSQGTYWGEMGYFRIKMYKDNNGIETDCSWGVPIIEEEHIK